MSRVGLPRAVDGLERIRTTTFLGRAVLSLAAIAVGLVGCKEGAALTQNKVTAIVGMPAIRLRSSRQDVQVYDRIARRVRQQGDGPYSGVVEPESERRRRRCERHGDWRRDRRDGHRCSGEWGNGARDHERPAAREFRRSVAVVDVRADRYTSPAHRRGERQRWIGALGRLIAFSTSNPGIATVNGAGVVVGASLGRAIITAQAVQDQVSGTSTIDIVPVPAANVAITPAGTQTVSQGLTLQLAATLKNASGNPLTGRTVNWSTSNASIATVSSTGLATGVALGTSQITCESEGALSSVSITVQPRPVASVLLAPNPGG